MKPIFGQPVGEIHPLIEQATWVARALHTLERLLEYGIVPAEYEADVFFVQQSYADMRALMDWLYAQGVKPADIDVGMFVVEPAPLPPDPLAVVRAAIESHQNTAITA